VILRKYLILQGLAALIFMLSGSLYAADFNGDGKSDILFHQASTGKNFMMLMNGKRPLARGIGFVRRLATSWSVAGIGDFNGDGKSDILFHQASTGKNFMMLMNGKRPLAKGMSFVKRLATSWSVAGIGDFNGDGKSDILFHQASTGKNFMMLMNGKRPLARGIGFVRRLDPSWSIALGIKYPTPKSKGLIWNKSNWDQVNWQ